MGSASRWMVRLGAVLAATAVLLPQHQVGGKSYGPYTLLLVLPTLLSKADFVYHAIWLFAPLAVSVLLLAASFRRGDGRALLRGGCLVALLGASFAMATQGSMLMTSTRTYPGVGPPSFSLALFLFVAPLLSGTVAIARVLGGAEAGPTATFVRASLGMLLLLNGLFMVDSWWSVFDAWLGIAGAGGALVGAWASPAGGLLVAAGEVLSLVPREAPKAPPAPGDPSTSLGAGGAV